MAMTFEVNGDNVWIVDSNKEQLDNCLKEWTKSHTDVRDVRAVKKLFENIKNDWETIDVLCANAGTKGPTALIEDISLTEWKECIEVNIYGIFLFCKLTVPLMKKQKSGSIINYFVYSRNSWIKSPLTIRYFKMGYHLPNEIFSY